METPQLTWVSKVRESMKIAALILLARANAAPMTQEWDGIKYLRAGVFSYPGPAMQPGMGQGKQSAC